MLNAIKLDTLRLDTGKPLIIIDIDDNKKNSIFLTIKDTEVLSLYFKYAQEVLDNK